MSGWAALILGLIETMLSKWFDVKKAQREGAIAEAARRNAEAGEAERRAAEIRDKTPDSVADDLDRGVF